jgi:Zn-dependent protease with chaperone function
LFQLYAIIIVGIAHAADRGYEIRFLDRDQLTPAVAAVATLAPIACALAAQWLLVCWARRRLARRAGPGPILICERALTLVQWTILAAFAAGNLTFGAHRWIQVFFGGDVILADLVLTITPPLIGLWMSWLIHYPVVRRLRDALAFRSLDDGVTPRPAPGRFRYALVQMRLHVLFLLLPLLLIVTWSEVVERWIVSESDAGALMSEALILSGAFAVFTIAPVIARVVLELRRLPDGPVRADLLRICHDHRVHVRDVLLWDTGGMMINGGVMGILGRLRYVMLTDALLERMQREQVHAVMAHEIGHVRRHHIPWMIGALMAAILVPSFAADLALRFLHEQRLLTASPPWWLEAACMVGILSSAFFAFGWVSRRFERQADAFAAQHLSGLREARGAADQGEVITAEAASAMQSALELVSRHSGVDPERRSWRHGSIRWRQVNLRCLIDQPLRGLPIDRTVRRIKLGVGIVLLALLPFVVRDIVAMSRERQASEEWRARWPETSDDWRRLWHENGRWQAPVD